MDQVTYIEPGRVEIWDVERPQLRSPNEAIVRPLAVATCDLDKALVRGATPWDGPFPLGHEGVAEVLEVGDGVASVRPGDRVCLPYQISCGTCRRCKSGLTSHCEGHGGTVPGSQYYGFSPTGRDWGGFLSDAVRVPFADHMLVPVPASVASEVVASLSDNIVGNCSGRRGLGVGGGVGLVGVSRVSLVCRELCIRGGCRWGCRGAQLCGACWAGG
jgi:threonine dehydrogenase-like Zn-dependent dehydrogenase